MEWRCEDALLWLGYMARILTIRLIGSHLWVICWDLLAVWAKIESRIIGYHILAEAELFDGDMCGKQARVDI